MIISHPVVQADAFDPMIMSIDANFRLCRRVNAAKESKDMEPLISPSFFLSQDEVDCYVTSQECPTTTEVHTFIYANNTVPTYVFIIIE